MRLFIAIELNDEMKDAFEDIQDAMWDAGMDGRFTSRENLHLTLAFIGEYGDADRVREVVEGIKVRPFRISPDGIGAFGDLWWAGIKVAASSGGAEPLIGLAKRVRRALSDADIPFDRKSFTPHITLVRRAENAGRDEVAEAVAEVMERVKGTEMTVSSISLMRSDRGRNGMIYTCIGRSR